MTGGIIMSSGSRIGAGDNRRKRPVEFSSDVSIIHSKAEDEENIDESDTDVGSHDFDAEDSFDFSSSCDVGEDDVGMAMAAASVSLPAPATTNTSDRIQGDASAKIRRLNLNDGDKAGGETSGSSKSNNYSRGNFMMGSESVKEKKAVASGAVVFGADNSHSISAATPSNNSPTIKASSSNIGLISIRHCKAAQSQSPDGSWNRSTNSMFVQTSCPPSSSVKGKGRQRCLFANNENGPFYDRDNEEGYVKREFNNSMNNADDDNDISPRDVTNFPSFATWDSPYNEKMDTSGGKGRLKEDRGLMDAPCSPPPSMSMPRCPPKNFSPLAPPPPTPSMKNTSMPHHRHFLDSITSESIQDSLAVLDAVGDDVANDASEFVHTSPPRARLGLRSYGRANSFLQMFSQESLLGQEHYEDVDGMEDDFIHKPDDDEADDEKNAISSPNSNHHLRPNHRRYTPALPEASRTTPSSFSRFLNDFEIVGTLGVGSFGSVYSVRNRTDRRLYAIKAAKREARGSSDRDRMLQEVYALSALSDKGCINSMHIVRYHQAWMEGNRLYIQTELCDSTLLQVMRASGGHKNKDGNNPCVYLDEKQRYKLLREILLALDLVHKSGMIHLDIKPENIFIKNGQYKVGDFGLVSKIENHDDVEEGDSRYMSMELLSGEFDDLTKVSDFGLR